MPKKTTDQSARLNLRPSQALRDQIFEIAHEERTTAGEVIRRAISLYAICRQLTANQELCIIDTATGEKTRLIVL